MRDIMWDIETLGTRPGSVVLSIGAVAFDPDLNKIATTRFYEVINIASSLEAGLVTDPDTLAWWKKQKPEAQSVIFEALAGGLRLDQAMSRLSDWLHLFGDPTKLRIWGNGADFDNVLMVAACHALGIKPSWSPFRHRCFRTLKNLFPGREPVRQGVHHNALADAEHQARWALEILNARRSL